MNTNFSVEIVADSVNGRENRLTTFLITLPRITLAEFNTHRVLSRNSASSRAIPFKKQIKRCLETPFIPIKFQKEHKGMQGTEYFEGGEHEERVEWWLRGRNRAVQTAKEGGDLSVTKQIVNRLLEPFMWHTIITTATCWENFFNLRADGPAEIHIQKIAYMMLLEYNKSIPKKLSEGEWHIPFGDTFDDARVWEAMPGKIYDLDAREDGELLKDLEETKIKIATARCARLSYLNYEGKDDYDNDLALHETLSKSGHWSPFEHCARPMTYYEHRNDAGRSNFRGWFQYRKKFLGENRKDPRVQQPGSKPEIVELPAHLFEDL